MSREDAAIGAERDADQLTKDWQEQVRATDLSPKTYACRYAPSFGPLLWGGLQVVATAVSGKEYLPRFSIFLLAHILRRPIIVYADKFVRSNNGEPYAPLDLLGIYLPTKVGRHHHYHYHS